MTIALSVTTPASVATAINASDVNTPVGDLKTHIENWLNGVQKAEVMRLLEVAAPTNPASGEYKLYFKSGASGKMYARDSTGTEVLLFDFALGAAAVDILQIQVFS